MHSEYFIAEETNTYGEKHTIKVGDVFNFHYNPDLSGEVVIQVMRAHGERHYPPNDEVQSIVIPAQILVEFIGRRMLSDTEERLENMSGVEFLEFMKP